MGRAWGTGTPSGGGGLFLSGLGCATHRPCINYTSRKLIFKNEKSSGGKGRQAPWAGRGQLVTPLGKSEADPPQITRTKLNSRCTSDLKERFQVRL